MHQARKENLLLIVVCHTEALSRLKSSFGDDARVADGPAALVVCEVGGHLGHGLDVRLLQIQLGFGLGLEEEVPQGVGLKPAMSSPEWRKNAVHTAGSN